MLARNKWFRLEKAAITAGGGAGQLLINLRANVIVICAWFSICCKFGSYSLCLEEKLCRLVVLAVLLGECHQHVTFQGVRAPFPVCESGAICRTTVDQVLLHCSKPWAKAFLSVGINVGACRCRLAQAAREANTSQNSFIKMFYSSQDLLK